MAIHRQLAMCRRVRLLRENAGLTQSDVADRLGISQAAYSRMESGASDLSLTRLLRIADMFNVTLTMLIEGL